jgi:hypothetical protein
MNQWHSWKVPKAFVWNANQFHRPFLVWVLINFVRHKVLLFQGDWCSRLQTKFGHGLHSPFMAFLTQVMWPEMIFQTVGNRVCFSNGRNLRPDGPWIAVGAFSPSLFIWDFARGQIAWGATIEFLTFVSHLSIAFRRVILRIVLVTQLIAVLHAGPLVSCHNFRSLHLSYRRWSEPDSSLLRPKVWVSVLTASIPRQQRLWKH